MTIVAKIIADSVSPQGIRLTTMQLRYPKFIHGEFMTHRVFSRNASSSRAIPVERLIKDVIDDPAMPVSWGSNKPGMQAGEELSDKIGAYARSDRAHAMFLWLQARDKAIDQARLLHQLGAHKQIVNRIIEPWCHINVVVTATEWTNFYALRRHPDAQPEMKALADAMWEAQQTSTPVDLEPGDWHLPYVEDGVSQDDTGFATNSNGIGIKVSVARCARVSYLTHEGKRPNIDDDIKLYDRLVGSVPLHASPAEHQATPDWQFGVDWSHAKQHGNLVGWRQYRKMLPNENVADRAID